MEDGEGAGVSADTEARPDSEENGDLDATCPDQADDEEERGEETQEGDVSTQGRRKRKTSKEAAETALAKLRPALIDLQNQQAAIPES